MARSSAKAPANNAKRSPSDAPTARKKTSSKTTTKTGSTSAAKLPTDKLAADSSPTKILAEAEPVVEETPSAIKKGRQPKRINNTQAIALGTAAAGISHLLGWL